MECNTCAVAEVGKTRMWVAVASFGVESEHWLAADPNLSSGTVKVQTAVQ